MNGDRLAGACAGVVGAIYLGMVIRLTVVTVQQHRLHDLWGFAAVAGSFALICLVGAVMMWRGKFGA